MRGVAVARESAQRGGAWAGAYDRIILLKPRVMALVVFTGTVGGVVAPQSAGLGKLLAVTICMALGAGACGALNMWYDADIDGVMARTARRPIPAGRIDAFEALLIGTILAIGSVAACTVLVNAAAAALLALTIAFYIGVYTAGLKRRTPYNIVIGGAAGAFPPMIGWAAATGSADWGSFALFLIIFLWTPPHFWALALFRSGDYARAGVPMMPIVAGETATTRQILAYTLLLVASSALPVLLGIEGPLYAAAACVLGAMFVHRAVVLAAASEPAVRERAAKRLFGFSIAYLFLLFVALMIGAK